MIAYNKKARFILPFLAAICCLSFCLAIGNFSVFASTGVSNAASDMSLNRAGLNSMTSIEEVNANVWKTNKLSLQSYSHADTSHGTDNGIVFEGAQIAPYLETVAVYENFELQFSIYANDLIRNAYAPNSTFRITFGDWKFKFPTNYTVLYNTVTCEDETVINEMNFETISGASQMLKFRLKVENGVAELFYTLNFEDDVAYLPANNYYVVHRGEAENPIYYRVESEKLAIASSVRIEFDNDAQENMKGKLILGDIRLTNLDESEEDKLAADSDGDVFVFGTDGVHISTDVAVSDFLGVSIGNVALLATEYTAFEENGKYTDIAIGDNAMLRYCLESGNYADADIVIYAKNNNSRPISFMLKNVPEASVTFVMPEKTVTSKGALGLSVDIPDTSSIENFVGWYDADGYIFDTQGLTYGNDITIYAKTSESEFFVTYAYTDVLGRDRSQTFSLRYGTNLSEYAAEVLTEKDVERFGYVFNGWAAENGEDIVKETVTVNAVYVKLSGNGQDIYLDFSKRPAAWEINDQTSTHSGGAVSYDGGYFRGYKQSAASRFVTRQMYTDFQLEFDIVELSGVEYGLGKQQILYLEFGMNDMYLGTYTSPMRVIIEMTPPEDEGDLCWVSLDGSTNYTAGILNRHLYDPSTATYERDQSGALVKWLSTGVGEHYFVSMKVVMKDGVLQVYSKDNSQSEYDTVPDFTVTGPENADTTGYVSIAGWSNYPDMDIVIGIDNYRLTNLSPRDSELKVSVDAETNKNGEYIFEAEEGDLRAEIDLRGQTLFAVNVEIGEETYNYDNLMHEDYDMIVDVVTFNAKTLAKIYNDHRSEVVNEKLSMTVWFISTGDYAEIPLSVGVPKEATISFYDGETLLLSVTKALGETIEFPDVEIGSRKFIGWKDTDGTIITDNSVAVTLTETYTAVFEEQFTVSFVDGNGKVIKTEIVNNKEGATPPEVHKKGYQPSWTGDNYLYVTGDTVAQLVWVREPGMSTGLPVGAIIGIVVGGVAIVFAVVAVIVITTRKKEKK